MKDFEMSISCSFFTVGNASTFYLDGTPLISTETSNKLYIEGQKKHL
jgi:hypothetical protein